MPTIRRNAGDDRGVVVVVSFMVTIVELLFLLFSMMMIVRYLKNLARGVKTGKKRPRKTGKKCIER